jgi:hypothetical protein
MTTTIDIILMLVGGRWRRRRAGPEVTSDHGERMGRHILCQAPCTGGEKLNRTRRDSPRLEPQADRLAVTWLGQKRSIVGDLIK